MELHCTMHAWRLGTSSKEQFMRQMIFLKKLTPRFDIKTTFVYTAKLVERYPDSGPLLCQTGNPLLEVVDIAGLSKSPKT
jgi:hypothetical protein